MADVMAVVLILAALVLLIKSVHLVGAGHVAVVERRGRYSATLQPGLAFLVPFVDRVRRTLDVGEQAVTVPEQPVVTEDGYVVSIETTVFLQVTDPAAATYQAGEDYHDVVRTLTTERLREVVGGMARDRAVSSGETIATWLRGVLDAALSRWGIRVNRVEVSGFQPWQSGTGATRHGS